MEIDDLAVELANRGITTLFGIPGSGPSLDLIDSCAKNGINFMANNHESASAIMAGTMGNLSGQPAPCIGIKGPGLANMLGGLAYCKLENYPVLAISENYSFDTPKSQQHKRLDHQSMLLALTKNQIDAGETSEVVAETLDESIKEIPGPTYVSLSVVNDPGIGRASVRKNIHPEESNSRSKFFNYAAKAKRPILIVGSMFNRNERYRKMLCLSKLELPVFTTVSAKGALSDDHNHSGGVFVGVGKNFSLEARIIASSDLVIGIGLRSIELLQVKAFPCASINIDNVDAFHDGFLFASQLVEPNIEDSLRELNDVLTKKSWGVSICVEARNRLLNELLDNQFLPASMCKIIQDVLGAHTLAVFDTGNFCVVAEQVWRSARPFDTLGAPQSRTMGVALPSAIAGAIYNRSIRRVIPTICIAGDGGLPMYIGEAKLAVELDLPLLIIMIVDGFYGSIRRRSMSEKNKDLYARISSPSLLGVFEGLGYMTHKVSTMIEFERAIDSWSTSMSPCFVEAVVDPEKYHQMINTVR